MKKLKKRDIHITHTAKMLHIANALKGRNFRKNQTHTYTYIHPYVRATT